MSDQPSPSSAPSEETFKKLFSQMPQIKKDISKSRRDRVLTRTPDEMPCPTCGKPYQKSSIIVPGAAKKNCARCDEKLARGDTVFVTVSDRRFVWSDDKRIPADFKGKVVPISKEDMDKIWKEPKPTNIIQLPKK